MMRIAAAALCALAGCGGKPSPTGPQPAAEPDAAPAAARADEPDAAPPALSGALSADECDRFIDHVFELMADDVAKRPVRTKDGRVLPPERNTDEEIAAIKAQFRSEAIELCNTMSRAMFECTVAATDKASLDACQPAGETSPPR